MKLPILLLAFVATVVLSCDPQAKFLTTVDHREFVIESPTDAEPVYPEELKRTYHDPLGIERVYMVQEPDVISDETPVLVFAHGAAGDERLGMAQDYAPETFTRLRNVMAARGWIYISIRDYEWDGLNVDIVSRYGQRPIYLLGSSAGGGAVLREALKNPDRYAGLILCCPASPKLENTRRLTMPMMISVGSEDAIIAAFCDDLVASARPVNKHIAYVVIPGGGHGTPLTDANWDAQIDYVFRHASERKP